MDADTQSDSTFGHVLYPLRNLFYLEASMSFEKSQPKVTHLQDNLDQIEMHLLLFPRARVGPALRGPDEGSRVGVRCSS